MNQSRPVAEGIIGLSLNGHDFMAGIMHLIAPAATGAIKAYGKNGKRYS
ncbi:hypothetical protein GCM10011297_06020 [Bacterioplanes sanyensis]|nr:hypothetical protein [Bacterioplanes sanyensis]GGY35806.1 hypothetical protein GCM10011297_06020 [Bacterioplanes sanyensis]